MQRANYPLETSLRVGTNVSLRQANHRPSMLLEIPVLHTVLRRLAGERVPVGAVTLHHDTRLEEREVNDVGADNTLRGVVQAGFVEQVRHRVFDAADPADELLRPYASTSSRAASEPLNEGWLYHHDLAADTTRKRRPRFVARVVSPNMDLGSGALSAFARTVARSWLAVRDRCRELLVAAWARQVRDIRRRVLVGRVGAFAPAVDAFLRRPFQVEHLAARLALRLRLGLRGIDAASMVIVALPAPLDMRGADLLPAIDAGVINVSISTSRNELTLTRAGAESSFQRWLTDRKGGATLFTGKVNGFRLRGHSDRLLHRRIRGAMPREVAASPGLSRASIIPNSAWLRAFTDRGIA